MHAQPEMLDVPDGGTLALDGAAGCDAGAWMVGGGNDAGGAGGAL